MNTSSIDMMFQKRGTIRLEKTLTLKDGCGIVNRSEDPRLKKHAFLMARHPIKNYTNLIKVHSRPVY